MYQEVSCSTKLEFGTALKEQPMKEKNESLLGETALLCDMPEIIAAVRSGQYPHEKLQMLRQRLLAQNKNIDTDEVQQFLNRLKMIAKLNEENGMQKNDNSSSPK